MAKIKVTEGELKQLIRESVENILNEAAPGSGVLLPADDINARNDATTSALSTWKALGTVGQIKEIQKLVGATPDGKMGPQTLAKIFIKLGGNAQVPGNALNGANFGKPGRPGNFTPTPPSPNAPARPKAPTWTPPSFTR